MRLWLIAKIFTTVLVLVYIVICTMSKWSPNRIKHCLEHPQVSNPDPYNFFTMLDRPGQYIE